MNICNMYKKIIFVECNFWKLYYMNNFINIFIKILKFDIYKYNNGLYCLYL